MGRKVFDLVCPTLLLVIHTVDMELTRHYMGHCGWREGFWPMRLCIAYFGMYAAEWISRACMYGLVLLFMRHKHRPIIRQLMLLGTTLYWAAMAQWLFDLQIFAMPSVVR
jgi:hypothetical protein